jgi:hypothetical protein
VKRLIAILLGVVLTLLLAPAASADKPAREFLPAEDFTLTGVCAFPVREEVTTNNEFITTFTDGRQLITGSLKVRATNLDSGKALDLNISGPGVITENADGSVTLDAYGSWLIWFFPGDLGPGSPGQLFVNSGHFVETFSSTGVTVDKQTGSQQDICAALA